jgi:predicted nucleotidyltransferase
VGDPQGGECLRTEGKRSAKAPRPALSLNPLSSALWQALLQFLAVSARPARGRFFLLLFGFVCFFGGNVYLCITISQRLPNMSKQTLMMIQLIAEYFKTQPVLKAWLFGSYARGEQHPDSDVDILVVFDQENGKGVSLLKHIGIALDLEDLLGKKVDLITEGTLLPFVRESAEKDKVLIYERAS